MKVEVKEAKVSLSKLLDEANKFLSDQFQVSEKEEKQLVVWDFPFELNGAYFHPIDAIRNFQIGEFMANLKILSDAGVLNDILKAFKQVPAIKINFAEDKDEQTLLEIFYLLLSLKLIKDLRPNVEIVRHLEELASAMNLLGSMSENTIGRQIYPHLINIPNNLLMIFMDRKGRKLYNFGHKFIEFHKFLFENPQHLNDKMFSVKLKTIVPNKVDAINLIKLLFALYLGPKEIFDLLQEHIRIGLKSLISRFINENVIEDVAKFVYIKYHTDDYWRDILNAGFMFDKKLLAQFDSVDGILKLMKEDEDFKKVFTACYMLYFTIGGSFSYQNYKIDIEQKLNEYARKVRELLEKSEEILSSDFKINKDYKEIVLGEIDKRKFQVQPLPYPHPLLSSGGVLAVSYADDENYYLGLTNFFFGKVVKEAVIRFAGQYREFSEKALESKANIYLVEAEIPAYITDEVRKTINDAKSWFKYLGVIWYLLTQQAKAVMKEIMKELKEKIKEEDIKEYRKITKEKEVQEAYKKFYESVKQAGGDRNKIEEATNKLSAELLAIQININELLSFYNKYKGLLDDKNNVIGKFYNTLKSFYEEKEKIFVSEFENATTYLENFEKYLKGEGEKPKLLDGSKAYYGFVEVISHELFHILEGDVFDNVAKEYLEAKKRWIEILRDINMLVEAKNNGQINEQTLLEGLKSHLSSIKNDNALFRGLAWERAIEVAKEDLGGLFITFSYKIPKYTPPVSQAYLQYIGDWLKAEAFPNISKLYETKKMEQDNEAILETLKKHFGSEIIPFDNSLEFYKDYISFRIGNIFSKAITSTMYHPLIDLDEINEFKDFFVANNMVVFDEERGFAFPFYTTLGIVRNIGLKVLLHEVSSGKSGFIFTNGQVAFARVIDYIFYRLEQAVKDKSEEERRRLVFSVREVLNNVIQLETTKYRDIFDILFKLAKEKGIQVRIWIADVDITGAMSKRKFMEQLLEEYIPKLYREVKNREDIEKAIKEVIPDDEVSWKEIDRIPSRLGELYGRLILKYDILKEYNVNVRKFLEKTTREV